jgi:misacylated tRNA(Ala) deacylase
MSFYPCHSDPDCFVFYARIVARRPGAVCLDKSYFYPGGGGQLPDRGVLRWVDGEAAVTHIEQAGGRFWHCVDADIPGDDIIGVIDERFRSMMCQLHTDLHVLNALVYQHFDGALVTGVQMSADGTARIDFDLPGADNQKLKEIEPELNGVILADLPVHAVYVPAAEAAREAGLIRSRSVAPPRQENDTVRIIEIEGLDRQACGGTHLSRTSQSKPVRILKIENKGQRNRRVRIGLVDEAA